MEVYQINTGWFKLKSNLSSFSDELKINSKYPALAYLIKSNDKLILFDTGTATEHGLNIGSFTYFMEVLGTDQLLLDKQLNLIGYDVNDIDIVINSHLHFDHCSGNYLFKNKKKILIQEDELISFDENIKNPMYSNELFIENSDFHVINGEYKLFDSPTITLIPTNAHSKGHQILLVEDNDNLILFSSDCFYEKQGEFYPIKTTITTDSDSDNEYSASLEKVKEIIKKRQGKKVTIFYCHDLKFENKILNWNFQIIKYNF